MDVNKVIFLETLMVPKLSYKGGKTMENRIKEKGELRPLLHIFGGNFRCTWKQL